MAICATPDAFSLGAPDCPGWLRSWGGVPASNPRPSFGAAFAPSCSNSLVPVSKLWSQLSMSRSRDFSIVSRASTTFFREGRSVERVTAHSVSFWAPGNALRPSIREELPDARYRAATAAVLSHTTCASSTAAPSSWCLRTEFRFTVGQSKLLSRQRGGNVKKADALSNRDAIDLQGESALLPRKVGYVGRG